MTAEATIEEAPVATGEIGSTHEAAARSTVKYYAAWSFGAGLVAIPIVELMLIVGVQMQMLRKLSDIYGVKFSEHVVRNVLVALLGGLAAETIGASVAMPIARAIPGIGSLLGLLVMPAFAVASTVAVGEIFVQHFEKGGTFLDFKPSSVKDKFSRAYDAARAAARA
jgi:uncharacterized protein (DUF697 family)